VDGPTPKLRPATPPSPAWGWTYVTHWSPPYKDTLLQWTPECWWWNHIKSQLWMLKSHFFPSDQLYIHSVPPALSQSFRHVECDTCGCRWNADGMPLPLCRYAPCLHSHPKQVPLLVARVDLDVSLVRGCSLVENNLMVKKQRQCNLSNLQM